MPLYDESLAIHLLGIYGSTTPTIGRQQIIPKGVDGVIGRIGVGQAVVSPVCLTVSETDESVGGDPKFVVGRAVEAEVKGQG